MSMVLASVLVTGCYAWHTQPSVASAVAVQPEEVQVRLTSGEKLVLESPRIVADSLIGYHWVEGIGGQRVALLLATVSSVAFREFDALRTGALVASEATGTGIHRWPF
jgi:hypothetical protein